MSDIRTTLRKVAEGYVITIHDSEAMVYTCGHVHLDRLGAEAHLADLDDAIARARCGWCNDPIHSSDTYRMIPGDLDHTPDDFVVFCSSTCESDANAYDYEEMMARG